MDAERLIAAYLDDSLSEAERSDLTAWLRADAENLRIFTEAVILDQQIRETVEAEAVRESAEPFVAAQRSASARGANRWRKWLALAACIALLALAGVWLQRSAAPPWIANIALTRGAIAADAAVYRTGQKLPSGRVTLSAGAMELLLSNGVRVVFEGPGELELLTPMRAALRSGQAVVRVPENAKGFQLETPAANVEDLGTEFGVKVGPGLSTDVQVYEGVVVTTANSVASSGSFPQRITAGNAARFAPGENAAGSALQYAPQRFVRRLPVDRPIELTENADLQFNATHFEELVVSRPEQPIVADGDLSEWSDEGAFRAQREGSDAARQFVEGRMRYDDQFLYIGAHIGDPAPMKSVIDPATDPELGWRGGGLQVRLATDRALGWPVDANAPAYYQFRRMEPDATHLANATSNRLAHLTMWYYAPTKQGCLHVDYGMDFHGGMANPSGYRAAFRLDADGRGYTLEYAVPWSVLNAANDPPRSGDELAMSWTAHWSDKGGRLWRGQLVEIRNAAEPLRIHTWERAATWGRAFFR